MKEAQQNSLNDLIASGGLPEATPTGEKTREQLIADKDFLYAEVRKLRAERDAEFVRGLKRALELMRHATFYGEGITAILAEIDKARVGK